MSQQTPSENGLVGFLKQRWLTIVLVVLAALFVIQNQRDASIQVLWLRVNSPLWLVLTALFLAGFAAGAFYYRRRKAGKAKDS
jgi:lipopolysaccharide assembly protein A